MPSILMKTNRKHIEIVAQNRLFPTFRELGDMLITFGLIVFTWIFFRAENIQHAFSYITGIFDRSLFSVPNLNKAALATLILIAFFMFVEWLGRESNYAIERLFSSKPRLVRWAFYGFILLLIGLFMQTNETPFIYFQF